MPKGTPVEHLYKKLLAEGHNEESAARIAQAETGLNLQTGKPPKGKENGMGPDEKLEKGEKVKDNYGRVLTVMSQRGTSILTEEDPNNWIHVTKLHKVNNAFEHKTRAENTRRTDSLLERGRKAEWSLWETGKNRYNDPASIAKVKRDMAEVIRLLKEDRTKETDPKKTKRIDTVLAELEYTLSKIDSKIAQHKAYLAKWGNTAFQNGRIRAEQEVVAKLHKISNAFQNDSFAALSTKEKEHLAYHRIKTLEDLRWFLQHQYAMDKPCKECSAIGRKLGAEAVRNSSAFQNGRQRALDALAPKLERLENAWGTGAKTMTRAQIQQMVKDGKAEIHAGDLSTVRSGSYVELRMAASGKVVTIQVEG